MLHLLKNYSYYDSDWQEYNYLNGKLDDSTLGVVAIIAFIVSIIVYFTFLSKRNRGRFTGFTNWLYEVFSFGKLMVEAVLKVMYMFFVIWGTVIMCIFMTENFGAGLLGLILYQIVIRVSFELIMLLLHVFKNTKEINQKLKDQNTTTINRNPSQNIPPQAPMGQPMMYGQPMGMQQPNGVRQPMGMHQQPSARPMGMQQNPQNASAPMGMQQKPTNTSAPMGMQQNPTNAPASMGMQQQPMNAPTSMGMQQQPMNAPTPMSMQHQEATVDPSSSSPMDFEELPKIQNVKYCGTCGTVVDEEDLFCPNCGAKLSE